jgi:hypothetical protein
MNNRFFNNECIKGILFAFTFVTLYTSSHFTLAQNGVLEKNGIKLTPVTNSPLFPDAELKIKVPANDSKQDLNVVRFEYELKNYELSMQTSDAKDKHCNNSAKGQHIHVILNNEPYLAKYETDFSETLKEGNYVLLSFLSRSYHESLKHKKAYTLTQFSVGNGTYQKVDLKKPLLFYSRPKGEYTGEDVKQLLLDFYIVNTTLSPKGNKVRATINGTEFMITSWQAFFMEGLPLGENTIKLELLDKNNVLVNSAYSSVTRTITLK